MALKLSISTSASPRRKRSQWGLMVTQDAYFSLLTYNKQLLLVTFCDTLEEIEVSCRWDGNTEPEPERGGDEQTDVEVEIVI